MKFVKSNLAKKLIIILIALMIFNVAMPQEVNAGILDGIVDIAGGILFLPLKALLISIISNININLGRILRSDIGTIDSIINSFNNTTFFDGVKKAVGEVFIGPEDIFSGEIKILNANIFENLEGGTIGSILSFLTAADPAVALGNNVRTVVANIYILLRNICALIMLAGLIYTGIRILITSNIPSKKMQYLMLLEDWVMGMALLIFSHIIMIIIFEISEGFVNLLSKTLTNGSSGLTFTIAWYAIKEVGLTESLTYLILYGYMTWLTFVFAISYFKRFFWIVILTIFAPVVSIMYAFGQQTKQIYTRWLKEYTMTVFVQPFHMLVYFVLVMIPMGIASGGSGFSTGSSLLSIVYALIAISFIRPAEKYLRELFGMDKGIAGAASYDSGIAPIKAAAGAAMKVGGIAATAMGQPMAGKALAIAAENVKQSANEGGDTDGATSDPENNDDNDDATAIAAEKANDEISAEKRTNDTLSPADELAALDQAEELDNKQFYSAGSRIMRLAQKEKKINDKVAAGQLTPEEEEEQRQQIADEREEIINQTLGGESRNTERDTRRGELAAGQEGGNEEGEAGEKGENKNSSAGVGGNGEISVGNLTINASNIDINGGNLGTASSNAKTIGEAGATETDKKAEGEKKQGTGSSETKEDENFEKTGEGKSKKRIRDYMPMSVAGAQLGNAYAMLTGKKGMAETAQNWLQNGKIASPYRWLGKGIDKMADSKIPIVRNIGSGGMKVKEMAKNGLAFADRFEKLGGFTELYKGINSVRDTMYVNGAPGDWKDTATRMDDNKKRRDEKAIYNFTNKPENKQYVEAQLKMEAEEKYKNDTIQQQKYVDANLENKLQSLAKNFAPYGITDARLASSLKSDQKEFGYTTEEAIIQGYKFHKFNSSTNNISIINEKFGLNSSTPISAKIPDAREYYNRGITDINTMINADQIAIKLSNELGNKISEQMRRDIAATVAKKGGVSYGGSDENIRKVINEITKKKGK